MIQKLVLKFLLFDSLDLLISSRDFLGSFLVLNAFSFLFAHVLLVLFEELLELLLLFFDSLVGLDGLHVTS